MRNSRGFTIIEVLLALILLTLGLLALGTSGLCVNTMLERSGRSAAATNFASRRLELLRSSACVSQRRADGSERLLQGSSLRATNRWWFEPRSGGAVIVRVSSTYVLSRHRVRADTLETTILCR